MEFQDKTLQCIDCGSSFIWTAGEQAFFADKGFRNEPKRCRGCNAKRAAQGPAPGAPRERVETTATCRLSKNPLTNLSLPGTARNHFSE